MRTHRPNYVPGTACVFRGCIRSWVDCLPCVTPLPTSLTVCMALARPPVVLPGAGLSLPQRAEHSSRQHRQYRSARRWYGAMHTVRMTPQRHPFVCPSCIAAKPTCHPFWQLHSMGTGVVCSCPLTCGEWSVRTEAGQAVYYRAMNHDRAQTFAARYCKHLSAQWKFRPSRDVRRQYTLCFACPPGPTPQPSPPFVALPGFLTPLVCVGAAPAL